MIKRFKTGYDLVSPTYELFVNDLLTYYGSILNVVIIFR